MGAPPATGHPLRGFNPMSELNDVRALTGKLLSGPNADGDVYRAILAEVDRAVLEVVTARCGGNQVRMAAVLGLNRSTLREKLRKAGIKCDGRYKTTGSNLTEGSE